MEKVISMEKYRYIQSNSVTTNSSKSLSLGLTYRHVEKSTYFAKLENKMMRIQQNVLQVQ